MRHPDRTTIALLLLAALIALGGCTTTGGSTTGTLTPDESAVPEGMPVMYEFYTTS